MAGEIKIHTCCGAILMNKSIFLFRPEVLMHYTLEEEKLFTAQKGYLFFAYSIILGAAIAGYAAYHLFARV